MVCGSSHCYSTLLGRGAFHLHLASAAHISVMLLTPVNREQMHSRNNKLAIVLLVFTDFLVAQNYECM